MEENVEISAEKQQKRVIGKPWPKGVSGNPAGKPKGTLSFTTKIKKIFEENPDLLEEVVRDYIHNPKYRELLWKMIDGLPANEKATLNVENLENLTIVLDRDDT